jgi:sugar phosphate isomerase/epimerase
VPIEDRISALAANGWSGLGLVAADLKALQASIGFDRLREMVRAHGLEHVEVELLTRWWEPRSTWQEDFQFLLEAARALDATFIKAGAAFGEPASNLGFLSAPLHDLAEEAAANGTRIALEPVAFTQVGSVPQAADLVREVNHPACGLLVDFWHVFRAGTTLAELRESLTADQIFGIELCDAENEVIGSLFEDTRDNRKYCGQGSQDVAGFIAAVRDIGFDGPWGVEIISEEHRARPVQEALATSIETTRRFFEPTGH